MTAPRSRLVTLCFFVTVACQSPGSPPDSGAIAESTIDAGVVQVGDAGVTEGVVPDAAIVFAALGHPTNAGERPTTGVFELASEPFRDGPVVVASTRTPRVTITALAMDGLGGDDFTLSIADGEASFSCSTTANLSCASGFAVEESESLLLVCPLRGARSDSHLPRPGWCDGSGKARLAGDLRECVLVDRALTACFDVGEAALLGPGRLSLDVLAGATRPIPFSELVQSSGLDLRCWMEGERTMKSWGPSFGLRVQVEYRESAGRFGQEFKFEKVLKLLTWSDQDGRGVVEPRPCPKRAPGGAPGKTR